MKSRKPYTSVVLISGLVSFKASVINGFDIWTIFADDTDQRDSGLPRRILKAPKYRELLLAMKIRL